MNFQISIGFTRAIFFKFMKQLSEDVDIFKISKSWIQNLKISIFLKISKIMFLVFLDGFDKKIFLTFFFGQKFFRPIFSDKKINRE